LIVTLQYLKWLIEQTPNLYLCELKADLEENWGVLVDTSTIYQMLHRQGFALKKNSFVASNQVEENHIKYQIEVSENFTLTNWSLLTNVELTT
jgi:transposase